MIKLLIVIVPLATLVNAQPKEFSEWLSTQKLESGTTLTLPKGIHHARPDDFASRFLHISNNDDGIKHIVFDLSGLENVTIDGNGAELLMHGHVIPFFMKNAKNITIKNLTIDWAHPFYVQGEIIDTGSNWFEIKFEKDYTVELHDGELVAINPDLEDPVHFHNINYIDPKKGEQAYRSADEYNALKSGNHTVTQKADDVFRITSDVLRNKPKAGQIAVFQYSGRTSPAISVQNSENIRIENVTQYHAAAIANIFEGSKNIYIDRMTMTRRGERWYSALNDATHFVDCGGDIHITRSLFEFQGDDAANIHGIYRTVDRTLGDNGLRLKLMHFQQLGVDSFRPGNTVALCSKANFQILEKAVVKNVEWLEGGEYSDVTFESPLPELDWSNVVVMLHEDEVNVDIAQNRIQNNRARGLLIKTLGKVRIHDNYFHTPGAAVKIRIDASSWYEAGPVEDVDIFKNTFDQCKFGAWSRALFAIDPTLNDKGSDYPVMKNIRIHENKIIQIYKPLVVANNVENLEFYDNEITAGTGYDHWETFPKDFRFDKGVTTGKMQK